MRGRVRVEKICHRVFQVCSQAGRMYTLYMTASIYPFYLYTQHCKISGWWFGTFFHILGIIIPTDQMFFKRGWNHQPYIVKTWRENFESCCHVETNDLATRPVHDLASDDTSPLPGNHIRLIFYPLEIDPIYPIYPGGLEHISFS